MVSINEEVNEAQQTFVEAKKLPSNDESKEETVLKDQSNTENKVDVSITSEEVSIDEFEKGQKAYQNGKKSLLLNKYDEAVSNMDEACKIYSKKYGEMNIECADIYFYYGRALLELARVENTVLGNALDGIPDDSAQINDSRYGNPDDVEEKEKEAIAEKVIDAMCDTGPSEKKEDDQDNVKVNEENTSSEKEVEVKVVESKTEISKITDVEENEIKNDDAIVESKDNKKEDEAVIDESDDSKKTEGEIKKDDNNTEAVEEEEEEENAEEDVGNDDDDDDGENGTTKNGDDEEISNLQRAWEMFELSKLIYKNNCDTNRLAYTKRISECLLKLGEISFEQELYEQAIIDIQESINIQENELGDEKEERSLAETYYQLGLAQQFNNQFKYALDSYKKATNILQARMLRLNEQLNNENDEIKKSTINDEINELVSIIPEITNKFDECNDQDQQTLNLVKEAKECFLNKINSTNGSTTSNGNETTEVKDITSLVKSKRKISLSLSPSKKTKLEDNNLEQDQNGDSAINDAKHEQTETEMSIEQPVSASTNSTQETN